MSERFAARAAAVAAVAAKYADEVDSNARPPLEAVEALKQQRLLSVSVPTQYGGEGATMRELSEIATTIGAGDANAGMVFAMHHSQALILWRHGSLAGVRTTMRKVLEEEWLLGSATTERGIGGDARRSNCSLEYPAPGRVRVVKDAPVISYAEASDAILVTGRVNEDAPASDQRMLICPKGDFQLEKTGTWQALGLRGTASDSFILTAETSDDMLLDDDYGTISAHTALPTAHLLWSSVWLGIAASAADQARATVRRQARAAVGYPPPSQLRLAELMVELQSFADTVRHSAEHFDRVSGDPAALGSISFALSMNAVKITSANAVVDLVLKALRIVGIAGYRTDTPQTLSRQIRDALGAPIQINNDRLLTNNAPLSLMAKVDL
jgi:acyl-CoA dehydrogenase